MNSAGLIGFEKLPREIRGQLDGITERWKQQLGARLIGLYLHDSIALDGKPCPIEISAVPLYNAQNWKNPGSCVFHYSEFRKAMC